MHGMNDIIQEAESLPEEERGYGYLFFTAFNEATVTGNFRQQSLAL